MGLRYRYGPSEIESRKSEITIGRNGLQGKSKRGASDCEECTAKCHRISTWFQLFTFATTSDMLGR